MIYVYICTSTNVVHIRCPDSVLDWGDMLPRALWLPEAFQHIQYF